MKGEGKKFNAHKIKMIENLKQLIQHTGLKHGDWRVNVFNIEIKHLQDNQLALAGRVLEQDALTELTTAIAQAFPNMRVDVSAVRVLRQPAQPKWHVGTNITSVHAAPSWLGETYNHLVFGDEVEPLEELGRWVYTRQADGYLAWAYKPFLTPAAPPAATHIVLAPLAELRSAPDANAPIVSRTYAGTRVCVSAIQSGWAHVTAHAAGWLPLTDVCALDALPRTSAARRQRMMNLAPRMMGTPYLWGGASGNGIDCSGFARLVHAWAGITIPRDADMQCAAAAPAQPPYQPGDLFFFGEGDSARKITHVGVCMGGWKMIHSSRSRNGVYIDDVQEREDLRSIFVCAGSFVGNL